MDQDNMKPTEQPAMPTTPAPIVGNQPSQVPATPGTENRSGVKIWLPRIIIAAMLVNLIPPLFDLFGQEYHAMGITIRNYMNIAIIVAFLIIIFKQVTSGGNDAQN